MNFLEEYLTDPLLYSLLEKKKFINTQLKEVQKQEQKLNKLLHKKQKNYQADETSAFLTQHKLKMDKQKRIKIQLREKLNIIELKIMEFKRKQVI
jgi:hypothetical protein